MSEVDMTEVFPMEDPIPLSDPVASPLSNVSYDLRSRRILNPVPSPSPRRPFQPILGRSMDNYNCSNGRDAGDSSEKEDRERSAPRSSPVLPENRREEHLINARMEAMMDSMRRMQARIESMEEEAGRVYQHHRQSGPAIRVSTQPPQFDGTEDWKSYLVRFENCAQLAGWSQVVKTKMLSCCLTKSAQKFYSELPENDREDYERVTLLLGQRFGDKPPETYQALLTSRTRKSQETVHELKDDLWRLVGKAYPGINHQMQETMTLQALSRAFDPDLQIHLLSRNVRTVQEAVSAIESYEAIMKKNSAKDKKNSSSDSVRVYALGNENSKNTDFESFTCFKCGKKGHIARDCSAGTRHDNIICYKCGKQGHVVKDCPQRKKTTDLKCFVCGSSDHLAPKCPEKNTGNGRSPDQK